MIIFSYILSIPLPHKLIPFYKHYSRQLLTLLLDIFRRSQWRLAWPPCCDILRRLQLTFKECVADCLEPGPWWVGQTVSRGWVFIVQAAGFEHIIHMTVSHDCFFCFACIDAIVYLFRLLFRAISEEGFERFVQRGPSHLGLVCWFSCLYYIFDSFEVTLVLTLISPFLEWWIKDWFFLNFQSTFLFIIRDLFCYFLDWLHWYFFSNKWPWGNKWFWKRHSSLFIDLIVLVAICIFPKNIWVLLIMIRVIFVRILSSIWRYTCLLGLFCNWLLRRFIFLYW